MRQYQLFISEIKYPGQIDIYDNVQNIIKKYYPEKFGHWTVENKSVVKLHKVTPFETSLEKMIIDYKRFFYSFENPSSDTFFKDKFLSNYRTIEKLINSDKITRLGIRNFIKYGPINFDNYINECKNNKIFSTSFLNTIESSFEVDDIQVVLQNDNNRITMGPMKVGEQNYYTDNFVVNDNLDFDYILIDIDCFELDIKKSTYKQSFNNTFKRLLQIKQSMTEYFGDVIDE